MVKKIKRASKPKRTVAVNLDGKTSAKQKAAPVSASADPVPAATVRRRSVPLPVFKRHAKEPRPAVMPKLKSSFHILSAAVSVLWQHWRVFGALTAVYLLGSAVLVQGFGAVDLKGIKESISSVGPEYNQFAAGVVLLSALVASSAGSDGSGGYQSLLLLITSLAIIWALRRIKAGEHFRIRDAYYQGMYPLVPVLLVVLFIGVQLLPVLVGAALYSIVTVNGIAVSIFEQSLWIALFFLLGLWSLYMISSSLIAVYIAALPNMAPVTALRSAKKLVRYRRWAVLRRLLFLPIVLFVVTAVIMLPIVLLATAAAPALFYILTALWIPLAHSYVYAVYRELLP